MTGAQYAQSVVTVKAVVTPVTPVTVVDGGQIGHSDTTVKVVFVAGRPGATGGHDGHSDVTVMVFGGIVIVLGGVVGTLTAEAVGHVGHGAVTAEPVVHEAQGAVVPLADPVG